MKEAQGVHQQWTGVADQSRAAGGAARAAEAEARMQREQLIGEGRRIEGAAMDFAKATPQELKAYEASLAGAMKQNEQDMRLMDSIDPALMEASKQVLGLLRGDQTSMGGSYEKGRLSQRQQLVNSLRAQYGPGAESSSIGQRALQQFDMQSSEGAFGMQQQSLSSMMGLLNSRPGMERGVGLLSQSGQNFGNIAARQAQTQLGAGNVLMGAFGAGNQGVMNTVGSQYTEQLIRGRGQQQDHQTGVEFMGSFFGGKAGGGGGK